MSELSERQKAVATVWKELGDAHDKGEVGLEVYIGCRLYLKAYAMKSSYVPGALAIANEYCDLIEIDALTVERQVLARIEETIEFNRLTQEESS